MPNTNRNHTTARTTWNRIRDAYGPGYQVGTNFDCTLRTVAEQQRYPR